MQIIFCLVFTFNHITNKLSPNLKNIMHIKKETFSDLLTLVHVKPHNYNQDSNEDNTKISSSSPFSSTIWSSTFVRLAHDTDNIFCKFFVALLAHQVYTKNSWNKLQKEYSNTFGMQTIYHLFLYKAYHLSYYHNLPIVAMDQVVIRQYYV